ncbi:2OG-Fe dioxygenase family protein [Actinomadura oligospora]|uniref:2OG-Fe dioxygenase family protein n=1 Tax=Actinomadura oligospora TaxID=111804 RepID=UPI0004B56A3D|nr:2OG-Fe dioxygenase family protein [Actinomadura oligospora]
MNPSTHAGDNYQVIEIPEPSTEIRTEFARLPLDRFAGGEQRYRRFSQYRITWDEAADAWALELLEHRPFLQSPEVNSYVGGVQRDFEPLRIDPTAQIDAGAKALGLDAGDAWQINVHQCRVVANAEVRGVSVPEGPHRDGHEFGMLAVFARENIDGGENQLIPTGGGEPFFTVTLQPNQALVYDDAAMWHHATDIVPRDDSGGHRDLWIVAFNRWANRKYGPDFERAATATGEGRR